jgi:hypothetical protein
MLREARQTDQWIENKSLLLGQPIAGPNRYLLGYLAVKGTHATLASECPALIDPELFFLVVVRHFMQDSMLTDILLRFRNKMQDPVEAYVSLGHDVGDLFNRFQDLCGEFYADPQGLISKTLEDVSGQINRPTSALSR